MDTEQRSRSQTNSTTDPAASGLIHTDEGKTQISRILTNLLAGARQHELSVVRYYQDQELIPSLSAITDLAGILSY